METATVESTESAELPGGRKKRIIIGVLVVIVVIVLLLTLGGKATDSIADTMPTATVIRGDMIISLTESGEIRAADKTTIANDLKWPTIILERVDEGQYVKEGDLIIRFECKELLDAIDSTELELTSAENAYIQATETIELTRKDLTNKIAQAGGQVENRRNELEKFRKHEKFQQLQTAESELKLAQQNLEIGQGKLRFMQTVNNTEGLEGSYSQSTIDAEQLSVDRQILSVSNARAEVEKLRVYEHPQQERQYELSLEEANLELERAKLEAQAKQRQVEVDEKAKLSRRDMLKSQLEEMQKQKDMLEIRAKSPGVIIYDSGSRWNPADLTVGATVRPRQRLMRIPNMDTLKVYSRIYEGVSEKVKPGTPAIIKLDSREGLALKGSVDKVAPVASSENRWLNPDLKIFPIEIAIEDRPDNLKPGSSASVELILDEAKDVLKLNIAAVFTEQDTSYVWKLTSGKAERVDVVVDRSNATEVEVLEGLAEGDVVLLSPPSDKMQDFESDTSESVSKTMNESQDTDE